MVKKLLKYENMSYLRVLIPIDLILLGLAVINRLVQFFENDTTMYSILFTSSIILLIVGCVVSLVMTYAIAVIRFYKNLFTNEGYLTFTLPVTRAQLLWTKLLAALFFTLVTVVSVLLALGIASAGDMFIEIIKAGAFLLGKGAELAGRGNFIGYIVELLLLLPVSIATSYLLMYACIAFGQLSKKNRVLMAFLTYFIYMFICQTIGTIVSILGAVVVTLPWVENMLIWITEHSVQMIHVGLIGGTLLDAVLGLVYYLITNVIVKKKLNLE